MNQDVTAYIEKIAQEWQRELCTRLREILLEISPEIEERLQYGKPHYLKHSKYLCVYSTAKGWVSCTIFNATALAAPEGFFEPGEPNRKTVKFRAGQAVDYQQLAGLITQAAATL
jgi:hypothetical protein